MAFSIWAWPLQVRESHRSKLAAATSIHWIRAKNSPKMLSAERELRNDQKQTGGVVGVSEILTQIDREIAHLKQARSLLASMAAPGSKKKAKDAPAAKKAGKKRSEE